MTRRIQSVLVALSVGVWTFLFAVPAGAVVPADLQSDVVIWLSADEIAGIGDGGNVPSWPDISGVAGEASRDDSVDNQPVYLASAGPNGGPVVRFETNEEGTDAATSDAMRMLGPDSSPLTFESAGIDAGGTFVAVLDANTSPGPGRNRAPVFGTANALFDIRAGGDTGRLGTWRHALQAAVNGATPDGFFILSVRHSDLSNGAANSVDVQIGADGGPELIIAADGTNSGVNSLTDPLLVGSTGLTSDAFFGGDLAELIVFRGALGDDDLNRVGDALSGKYILPWPEPTSLSLLGLGALAILRRRR